MQILPTYATMITLVNYFASAGSAHIVPLNTELLEHHYKPVFQFWDALIVKKKKSSFIMYAIYHNKATIL